MKPLSALISKGRQAQAFKQSDYVSLFVFSLLFRHLKALNSVRFTGNGLSHCRIPLKHLFLQLIKKVDTAR